MTETLATSGSIVTETPFITPPPTFISPVERVIISVFGVVTPLDQSLRQHATFVAETSLKVDISVDMFQESLTVIPETPSLLHLPSPQPILRRNFIETQPITPLRLQGQRGRNWDLTRLIHLPPVTDKPSAPCPKPNALGLFPTWLGTCNSVFRFQAKSSFLGPLT